MDPAVMESMTSLGMIQKISTGFVLLDLALCMLLPVALQKLRPTLQKLWARFMAGPDDARFTRHIKFIKREGYYHYDPSERNHILQEAILLYIGSRKDLIEKFAVRATRMHAIAGALGRPSWGLCTMRVAST